LLAINAPLIVFFVIWMLDCGCKMQKEMKFVDIVKEILTTSAIKMTPQEIRDVIKTEYPNFYGTQSHIRNVDKGHYKDLDHALLAQIYTVIRTSKKFLCDRSSRPLKVYLYEGEVGSWPERKNLRKPTRIREISRRKETNYAEKLNDILDNADKYHQAYYQADIFSGPSLYFHQCALRTRDPKSLAHLEYVYATLSAWGMHRMGNRGSKMCEFGTFRRSIETIEEEIVSAQEFTLQEMNNMEWDCVEKIFRGLSIMASRTSLVGNSKAMHHMLPNIIPPIDRQYTLQFLRGNKHIKNDLDWEWKLMKDIIQFFFAPIVANSEFQNKADRWMARQTYFPWDISLLKIIDNLIIGSQK